MNFAVFLMGENFVLGEQAALQGFFVTKGIEAPSSEAAAAQAIAAVKAEYQFAEAISQGNDPTPTITVRVVHPLPHLMADTAYLFFPMADK